jgi:hypothetical protein
VVKKTGQKFNNFKISVFRKIQEEHLHPSLRPKWQLKPLSKKHILVSSTLPGTAQSLISLWKREFIANAGKVRQNYKDIFLLLPGMLAVSFEK